MSPRASTCTAVFEAVLGPQPRAYLALRSPQEREQIWRCIGILERDPYPDSEHITTLFIPPVQRFKHAFACDGWLIAFRVHNNRNVIIQAIAREV